MVFVMLDGSLYGPMGRFLECYMVRWVVFWMLYGPVGRPPGRGNIPPWRALATPGIPELFQRYMRRV